MRQVGKFTCLISFKKCLTLNKTQLLAAEEEGFEPPVVLPTTVFKTAALNRSAIPPRTKLEDFLIK